jgi:hypothetical protein
VTGAWLQLLVCGIAAVIAAAKLAHEVTVRAARRKRMRGGLKQIADHTAVTLIGTVRALGEPLIAPLSGTPCVFHRSTMRVLLSRGWPGEAQTLTRHEMIPFTLVTADGDVLVNGDHAEVTFRAKPIIPRKLERELAFLREADVEADPRQLGADEIVITAGMTVEVHGMARIEIARDAETAYRDVQHKVELVAHDNHPITIALV